MAGKNAKEKKMNQNINDPETKPNLNKYNTII